MVLFPNPSTKFEHILLTVIGALFWTHHVLPALGRKCHEVVWLRIQEPLRI